MNKEQVTFIIVLALLGLMYFTGGESRGRRRFGGRRYGDHVEAQKAAEARGRFLEAGQFAWDGSGGSRNFFLAPRETTDLPLAPLLPPPPPRLPTPGLPLILTVGGDARAKLRHELMPEEIDLTGKDEAFSSQPDVDPNDPDQDTTSGGGDEGVDLTELNPGVPMDLAARLRMSVAEKLERERRKELAAQLETERKKTLDQIHWPNGDVSRGVVQPLLKTDDRYELKLKIDTVRGDTSLGEDERKKILSKIRLVFFEDKGRDRKRSRQALTADLVQRIEFAESNILNRFHLRKLQTAKDDADAQWNLAKLIWDRETISAEEFDVLTTHLEEMVGAGMGDEKVYVTLADCYRRQFDYEKELKILQEALAKQPLSDSVALLGRFGQVCLRLKLGSKAEEAFAKALASDPGNALAHLGKGEALLEQGKAREASAHLRQAQTGVGLDKAQKAHAWTLGGEAYLAMGRLKAARNNFTSVLETNPNHARASIASAVLTFVEAGPAAARSVIDKALEANPLNGRLTYLKGVCQLRAGEYAAALETLTLCMDLDPLVTAYARTALSYLQEKAGQDEAALGEADQALVADPLNVEARLQRARCLLNVGDYETARDEYLEVLSADPGRVDILVALGDASFLAGNSEDAARFYSRAAASDEDFPALKARQLVCDVRRRARMAAEDHVKQVNAALMRQPFMQAAMAYYHYDRGNPDETVNLLRRIQDKKAGYPNLISYAGQVVAQVRENLAKELWRDDFNRSGTQILRGWKKEVGAGPTVSLSDNAISFSGKQRRMSGEPTVLYQERSGRSFHSFSADLAIKPEVGTYKGVGLIAFQRQQRMPDPYDGLQKRPGGYVPYYGAQVALSPDGRLQFRYLDKGKMSDWADLPGVTLTGNPMTIEFETIDAQKNLYRINVDGSAVANVNIPGLGRWGRALELQIFGQANIDRKLEFSVDNVTIITRKN